MAQSGTSGTPVQTSTSGLTHVTLTFNRQLTEEEIRQIQQQHNAVSAVAGGGGHHDHDHPRLL